MSDFAFKQGDDLPVMTGTIEDSDGNAVDLAGVLSVLLHIAPIRSSELVVDDEEVTITQASDLEIAPNTKGTWSFDISPLDLDPGGYYFEHVVTFSTGEMQTFPTDGYHTLVIHERLGEPAS